MHLFGAVSGNGSQSVYSLIWGRLEGPACQVRRALHFPPHSAKLTLGRPLDGRGRGLLDCCFRRNDTLAPSPGGAFRTAGLSHKGSGELHHSAHVLRLSQKPNGFLGSGGMEGGKFHSDLLETILYPPGKPAAIVFALTYPQFFRGAGKNRRSLRNAFVV